MKSQDTHHLTCLTWLLLCPLAMKKMFKLSWFGKCPQGESQLYCSVDPSSLSFWLKYSLFSYWFVAFKKMIFLLYPTFFICFSRSVAKLHCYKQNSTLGIHTKSHGALQLDNHLRTWPSPKTISSVPATLK